MKPKYYIIIICALIILLGVGVSYHFSTQEKQKVKPLENNKEVFTKQQSKALDSALILARNYKDSMLVYKNKPAVIITRYNEKIIYLPVTDNAIINAFTSERKAYIKKQQR